MTTRLLKYVAFLLVMCVPACFAPSVVAQTGATPAQKFDEFGDVYPTDAAARLDNFASELMNRPDARGFIIVYRSHRDLPGLSGRHLEWMRRYLIRDRGIPAERVAGVDGGEASCLVHEFWVVPIGATPKPRAEAYSRGFDDAGSARKFDEYHFTIRQDELVSFSTEYENGLESFAQALRKEPHSLAYIIAYEEYRVGRWEGEDEKGAKKTRGRVRIDPPGTAWRELRGKKAELVKQHGITASRVKLVNGGFRKWRSVELWIVPRGEHAPIPTPNAFPKGHR